MVGITDVACPVRDVAGEAIAALVMPFVNRVGQAGSLDAVLQAVRPATNDHGVVRYARGQRCDRIGHRKSSRPFKSLCGVS